MAFTQQSVWRKEILLLIDARRWFSFLVCCHQRRLPAVCEAPWRNPGSGQHPGGWRVRPHLAQRYRCGGRDLSRQSSGVTAVVVWWQVARWGTSRTASMTSSVQPNISSRKTTPSPVASPSTEPPTEACSWVSSWFSRLIRPVRFHSYNSTLFIRSHSPAFSALYYLIGIIDHVIFIKH